MDQTSNISARKERRITNKQHAETIQFVASKLAHVGDQLNQSYEELSYSRARSCIKLESCLDIFRLALKA